MQVVKTYCDRCHREIGGNTGYAIFRVPKYEKSTDYNPYLNKDVTRWAEKHDWDECCEDCATTFTTKVLEYAMTIRPSQELVILLSTWLLKEHNKDIGMILGIDKEAKE